MFKQYEVLACPFCHKGEISCIYYPGAWSQKRKTTRNLPGHGTIKKSADIWIIQSGCKLCGKSLEDVEKELNR